MRADQVEPLECSFDHRHRQRLGIGLRAHVVAKIVDDELLGRYERPDAGHRLGERVEQHVHAVGHAEVFGRTRAAFAHRAEAVRVVDQQAEVEVLFHRDDLVELAQIAFHAEYALGDDEHAAAVLLGQFRRMGELLAAGFHVVVRIYEALARVQPQPVDDAGMRLRVVDHHVAAREQRVDDRDHSLIAVVEQEGVGLAHESGQLALELLVPLGLSAHHAGPHRIGHAELGGRLGVGLAHLRMVGQAQVVVQAPVQHLAAAEDHVRADFALELRERVVAVAQLLVLADRTPGILFESFENIHNRIRFKLYLN